MDFDWPVGKVATNGNQTFLNKNPACCPMGNPINGIGCTVELTTHETVKFM